MWTQNFVDRPIQTAEEQNSYRWYLRDLGGNLVGQIIELRNRRRYRVLDITEGLGDSVYLVLASVDRGAVFHLCVLRNGMQASVYRTQDIVTPPQPKEHKYNGY